jgi:RHS repeat-associated protein
VRSLLLFILLTATAWAQTPPTVTYSDDFQSYGKNANPPGWVDTSIGNPHPNADGLYKTRTDPSGPNNGPNLVYGTNQSSGQPQGNNPRIGTFSTLSTREFSGTGRFEYRGRLIRTTSDARIGLTFFSSYPTQDKYYLIGLWSAPSGALTMQLFGFGAGTLTGTVDSGLTLTPNQWYRFAIQVDNADNATKIRARFWADGAAEPTTFSIDAADAAATRLTSGHIGMWAAVKGDAYIDDLFAKSPVAQTPPPSISLFESGAPLANNSKFNRDAVPEIRITGGVPPVTVTATLDGAPYTSLTPVSEEGWHTLFVRAVDALSGANEAQVRFLVDKTAPAVEILEGTAPFPPGFFFNRNVVANANVIDASQTNVTATLDGQPYTLGTPITSEGSHAISVTATDEIGLSSTAGPIAFVIDKTAPQLTFTSHQNNQVLSVAHAVIAGGSDDAVTVSVAGTAATVDTNTKVFASGELALLEGDNTIVATGTDRAGNIGTATLKLIVDTRDPEVAIASPNADACVDATSLTVSGTVADPRLDKITVNGTVATVTGATWSASIPVNEGRVLVTVVATDTAGHSASVTRSVTIDRTAPAIEVNDVPQFTNRPVAFVVRATDADPNAAVTSKLDGQTYESGTTIQSEGKHTLVVTATDCAGHHSDKTVEVTIDTTAPTIRNLNPANDATVGAMPSAISAVTDTDVTKVELSDTALTATPAADGSFTIAAVPFAEGTNTFGLVATDRAGNRGSLTYTVIVKTNAPVVEIRESGLPIAPATTFNRAVTPVIRSSDAQATISATLNGNPYTSGTTIANDGSYTLHATATDAFSHSGSADATFTIDKTAPTVKITSPANDEIIRSDHVTVRGTAGDSVAAFLNTQQLTLAADGTFSADVTLDPGPNPINLTGRDRAGNSASDRVVVTRDDIGAGIILTYPPDRSLTNRSTTDVAGRLLTPERGTIVKVGTQTIETDLTGAFRVTAFPLTEGENTITATATATNGVVTSATTHVTADFTPPSLTILESNQPLTDGARFATQAVISLQTSDAGGGAVVTDLTVDGVRATSLPSPITTVGGHSLVATARDLAGNESRAERTIFIGASTGTGGDCSLGDFDPASGSVIVSNSTKLVGRSGGALGVKVNGVAAIVADGSFSATVELPSEGANVVTIACTDANGTPTGTPATITLQRVTGDPSITIASPAEGAVTAQDTIAVTGTIGNGVVSADVNGVPATISGSTYAVPAVRLADGLNILVAHGRNAAGRVATASRRVRRQADLPSVSISAPAANTTTGLPKITVSGTWADLDPQTLTVQGVAATFVRFSDTTGSFRAADVPLVPGEQTLRVSGRDALNREASATVVVKLVASSPSIVITSPADHAYFGGGSTTFTVSGTFAAAAGSTVDINGSAATITGSSYSGSATFSTLAGGMTPVVARVTEPGGASAATTIIVTQLSDAPKVVESFPAPNAVEVDSGALLLVLFSQPMDVASLGGGAFRLQDASGNAISGSMHLDKDVLTFAPAALLSGGAQYTLRVTTAAKNLAGTALASEYTSTFTVATSAPAVAPLVDPIGAAVCGESITVTGTAPPRARVRLESATLVLNAQADANGKFTFTWPMSGQSGFALIRVRVVGSDGSVSPAAELNVRVDCSGPQVLNASYDRNVDKLTVQFSEPVKAATVVVGSSITLTYNSQSISGTATVNGNAVTITPAQSLGDKTFTLNVATTIEDLIGNKLITPFSQEFAIGGAQPPAGDGSGFISGEVYDATTGRPLASATISIDVALPTRVTTISDARGRYLARVPEGAHTIEVSLASYTTVWREIIVPAGAGVIPIDIRLTRRGDSLTHGGDTAVTKRVELTIPAGALPSGSTAVVTSAGAQALTGLLPLGWSPIASAEIHVTGTSFSTAQLAFTVPAAEIAAAAQNLTAVQYDAVRDEWRVLVGVVNIADGKASFPITTGGSYALVYPDKASGLTSPPLPVAGEILQGVPAAPVDAPPLAPRDFKLDPAIVLPSGRTVATLRIEGAGASKFPSGTAVQAYVDEELRLADGSRLLDPPFATDLLLYRTLAGDLGVADFHLAPSAKAAQVVLEIGFDHIRILPYPGRLDRGTLIGSEGGRVPADDKVAVEIPTGAVPEPLRATATSLSSTDLQAVGTIAGFRVVGGFQLTLQRATEPAPIDVDGDGIGDPAPPVELFVPARATFSVTASQLPSPASQVILGELLDQTPYGRIVRLAGPMMRVDPSQTGTPVIRFTTNAIDRSILPVDGVAHEGRYVVLAAESPIAFATGTVRLGNATGRLLSGARVTAPPLGVADLTRTTGIYNVAVPARPANPFTLLPRHTNTGDGVTYTHSAQVDPDAVIRVDLSLVAQPPVLGAVTVLKGEPPSQGTLTAGAVTKDVALTTNIRAAFTPSIDPASVTADAITVTEVATGAKVAGSAAAEGTVAVVWTLKAGDRLKPNAMYSVSIATTIRGTNGAKLANGASYTFSTIAQILNTEVHREKIRITMPDAGGVSRIFGDAGALPAGWQAVAVRRKKDFVVRYQATASADGSFSFFVGNGGSAGDRVTMGDLIDLQVINSAGNVAAIFALTPFVTEDGHGFVVPEGVAITFTSPEGVTLHVPAGAFDVPTLVKLNPTQPSEFTDVPAVFTENEYIGSVKVEFEGRAKIPLGIEIPLPAGYDASNKQFILAQKLDSTRGPRLAMVDILSAKDGKLNNGPLEGEGLRNVMVLGQGPVQHATLTGSAMRKYCALLVLQGSYLALHLIPPVGGAVGFAAIQGVAASLDIIWSIYLSYFVPHLYIFEHGGAIIPVHTGVPFTVTGIDPTTGLKVFDKAYDPVPFGPPFTATPIPSPEQNLGGPYPVYGSPFRVEILDLDVKDVEYRSIRNFRVILENNNVKVSSAPPSLDSNTKVELLNVSKGTFASGTADSTLTLGADAGDRIALLVERQDVDGSEPISIALNEPVYTGGSSNEDAVNTFLQNQLKLEIAAEPQPGAQPYFTDITKQARFFTDSGNRRINVELPSAMQRESIYRLTLKSTLSDVTSDGPGLKLGQGTHPAANGGNPTATGGGNDLHLIFHVRKPAGTINTVTISDRGSAQAMDLYGNQLFIASYGGDLMAYDVSNPVSIGAPIGRVPGPPSSPVTHLSVVVDRHGRVFATNMLNIVGTLRTYRAEDFQNGNSNIPVRGSTITNWKLGYSSMIGLPSNTILSDRPESIPLRVKVVLQDHEDNYKNRAEFLASGASITKQYPNDDLAKMTLSVNFDPSVQYNYQRVTVENLSLDMRWSADATPGGAAVFPNIIGRSTDQFRLVKNIATYAVIAHTGYGVAVYDATAVESNRHPSVTAATRLREQLVLTNAKVPQYCDSYPPQYGFNDIYITTDVGVRGDAADQKIYVYAQYPPKGLVDLRLSLPTPTQAGTHDDDCEQRAGSEGGLLFQTYPSGSETPRIQALRGAIAAAGKTPYAHLMGIGQYTWAVGPEQNKKGLRGTEPGTAARREYLLVAAMDLGLIVVEVNSDPALDDYFPLQDRHVADMIWIPGGAVAVRVIQSANLAVVTDRNGRAILVDLSRIDERFDPGGESGVFPTAKKALAGQPSDPNETGADDPRIIWKSEPGVAAASTAPPVFDPQTGMLYGLNIGRSELKVISAIDPTVRVKAMVGESIGLSDVGGIVPLGVAPPHDAQEQFDALPACDGSTIVCKENASLGAFQLEVGLPGNIVNELTSGELQFAVESERIAGAITEQTPAGFPRAHLRRKKRDGSAEATDRAATGFKFHRIVPDELASSLKNQRGYNKFVSPWIVAIADPRASKKYEWNGASAQAKKDAGCESCERPKHLKDLDEADGVYELFTNGRYVSVRPELSGFSDDTIFDSTRYGYLGDRNRLMARFSTIMADTVRSPEVLVAAHNPPIAGGMIQDTVFLHSGEVHISSIDLNAGGRAAVDVKIERTYRSRTIGGSVFGQGWDSVLLRRLRPLPNGDVELRDGAEIWRFAPKSDGSYVSPKGLFLRLARTDRGWRLVDQKWRITEFDDIGRVVADFDEFYSPSEPGSGNIIRYGYDDSGRLSTIIDPVQRASRFTYYGESETGSGAYPGLVKSVIDWRNRRIDYKYDGTNGTLLRAELPDVSNTSGGRPAIAYTYQQTGGGYNDIVEFRGNLETIKEPHEALAGGPARVTFAYDTASGFKRDRVKSQQWGTGENVSFTFGSPTTASTNDALGQARNYTLTEQPKNYVDDRAHITKLVEPSVTTSSTAFGELPATPTPGVPSTSGQTRTYTFGYNSQGEVTTSSLDGVRSNTYAYKDVEPEAPGQVIESATTNATAGGTIKEDYEYQTGPNSSTYIKTMRRTNAAIVAEDAHRGNPSPQAQASGISANKDCDPEGLVKEIKSNGGGGGNSRTMIAHSSTGTDVKITHAPADAPIHQRGLVTKVDYGSGVTTSINYPSADLKIETDERGRVTTTQSDSWEHTTHVTVTGSGAPVDQTLKYDASGRLSEVSRKQGDKTVTTTYKYDALSRVTEQTMDNVAGGGLAKTTITYNLPSKSIVTNYPGGAVTTSTIDSLGRVSSNITATGSSPIQVHYAYDLDGNLVYQSDLLTAAASAYDGHGRLLGRLYPDGSKALAKLDEWHNPTLIETFDSAGTKVGETKYNFTAAGDLEHAEEKVDGSKTRMMDFTWDSALRPTGVSTSGRAVNVAYDSAGRMTSMEEGEGSAAAVTSPFLQTTVEGHDGKLPQKMTRKERQGSAYEYAVQYNTNADVVFEQLGALAWSRSVDQAGNVTSLATPNRAARTYEYDSRGAVTDETLPGGASLKYDYTLTGGLKSYTDPTSENTQIQTDLIGRPLKRTYKDGTEETIEWEGRRVKSITSREGRVQSFIYNGRGQVIRIEGSTGTTLDTIDYDNAGRIVKWTNADSIVEYSDFNFDGNPGKTVQTRKSADGSVVDRYEQTHEWNEHGERTRWTMPSYSGLATPGPWTSSINQQFDAMGNRTKIQRQFFGGSSAGALLDATYRNAGRPDKRIVTTAGGPQIVRDYAYDSTSGLLNELRVTANGQLVAGSTITYNGLQKSKATLLGISGGARSNEWIYDARSRLQNTILARDAGGTPQSEELTQSDFRLRLDRPAETPVDPPSLTFTESTAGHKIDSVNRGGNVEQFTFVGGERREDGNYRYTYDAKGRLAMVTQKQAANATSIRRVKYAYDGNNRMIGRTAQYALIPNGGTVSESDWKLEDRVVVLAQDALPAETTFVWDPVEDQLVAIFKAGASKTPSIDPNGGLLRQFIHGGLTYDDPIEVTVADANAPSGVAHLYPVFDEAGAGMLQAVLDEQARIGSRSVAGGPYGEDEVILPGSAVDRVSVEAERDGTGAMTAVNVTLRTTESIAAASLTGGARLATVDQTGAVARTTTVAPALAGSSSVRWHLTAAEWQQLVDPSPVNAITPQALSIGVTSSLRAAGWNPVTPVMAAPAWARNTKSVYATAAMPVEVRESLASIATFVASTRTTDTLYEVPTLHGVGTTHESTLADPGRLISASAFHAHPFQEPLTNQNYVRARWFDTRTGVWLTPDPMGYVDSPNLYAYAGGDPVNGRDPRGEYEADFHYGMTLYLALKAGFIPRKAKEVAEGAERPDTDDRSPVPNALNYLLNPDPFASHAAARRLQDWHFPKKDTYSGKVVPCSSWAREKIESALRRRNLHDFAEGLHPFEDSWAHQGNPPIDGNSGHSRDKTPGQWPPTFMSHEADQTWQYPSDAMDAARAVYAYLQAFAFLYPDAATGDATVMPRKPQPWSSFQSDVWNFVNLRTKAEKKKWFTDHGIDLSHTVYGDLWDDVSLPER